MQKYIITNVVYGPIYLKIFLDHHLRSILDETNIPAIVSRYDITYGIFTDAETLPLIMDIKDGEDINKFTKEELVARLKNPNMKRLGTLVDLKIFILDFDRDDTPKFELRYSVLMHVFRFSLELAMKENAYLTAWVADLVVARDFFPKVLKRMEDGHGAVFVLPPRGAYETMSKVLNQYNRAVEAKQLWNIVFANLHHLWTSCEIVNRRFTRLPFCLIWSTPTGLMARSFSVTPIVFKPNPEMLKGRGMIDGEVPALCQNPYWATDWTDAPVVGCEPLFCYACQSTPGTTKGFIKRFVREWSKVSLHPSQIPHAKKHLYYPDRETAKIPWFTWLSSNRFVRYISK